MEKKKIDTIEAEKFQKFFDEISSISVPESEAKKIKASPIYTEVQKIYEDIYKLEEGVSPTGRKEIADDFIVGLCFKCKELNIKELADNTKKIYSNILENV